MTTTTGTTTTGTTTSGSASTGASARALMEGSEALVRAAILADCRFFAGYPMTPFTEVLEHFAALLPDAGGVCINAESEIEAVGMAWGAVATGARAATGSTGQGLALMDPTSMCPKPRDAMIPGSSPCLSKPAANPTGLSKSKPKTLTLKGFH